MRTQIRRTAIAAIALVVLLLGPVAVVSASATQTGGPTSVEAEATAVPPDEPGDTETVPAVGGGISARVYAAIAIAVAVVGWGLIVWLGRRRRDERDRRGGT